MSRRTSDARAVTATDRDPGPRPASTADPAEGDRRTIRRALRAGGLTTAVLSVVAIAGNLAFGGDGVAAAVWVTSAVVVGALVSSGWLVLALALDLIAGVIPSRRRVVWTFAVFAIAFVSPVLPAAMLQVAAAR